MTSQRLLRRGRTVADRASEFEAWDSDKAVCRVNLSDKLRTARSGDELLLQIAFDKRLLAYVQRHRSERWHLESCRPIR